MQVKRLAEDEAAAASHARVQQDMQQQRQGRPQGLQGPQPDDAFALLMGAAEVPGAAAAGLTAELAATFAAVLDMGLVRHAAKVGSGHGGAQHTSGQGMHLC